MLDEPPLPKRPRTIVGRDEVLRAIEAALERPGWTLLEGPPGSGLTTLLEHAREQAEERGLAVAWWPRGGPPPGWAPDGARVVCIDEAQELDRAVLRAVPADASVVAAVRTGVIPADPPALGSVRADRATVSIALEPLAAEHAAAESTGGNALLVALLAERSAEAILPWVGRYWNGQLDRAPAGCRPLAESLLVLGDEAPLWVAAEVAGLSRADAAEAADALAALGLVAAGDPLRVAIPLAADALRASSAGARHADVRMRAAQVLARAPGGAERAAELLLAVSACGETWPAEVLRQAAQAAGERGDNEHAVACLERALAEPVEPALRAELLVELGGAHDRGGTDGALEAYRQAVRVASRDRRPPIRLLLGRALYGAGEYREAALELDRGLAELGDADDPLSVELVAAYVAAARFDRTLEDAAARLLAPLLGRSDPGRTPAERALLAEVALEHGIRGEQRDVVVSLALRAWADGLLLDGYDHYGITVSQVAAALTWSDAFLDSDAVLTATIEHAEREGEELIAATAHYLRAWPRYYLGELAAAELDVRAALESPSWRMYEPSARAILGHVLIDRGDDAAAREALTLGEGGSWQRTVPFAMLLETRARLHLASGDPEAAAADLEEAGELLGTMGNASPFCPWRSRLGVVVAQLGDVARGRELVELELEQAERIGLPRCTGLALHARALISDDGVADLERAVVSLELAGARVEHARALTSLGRAHARLGRRAEARTALRQAMETADVIGARAIAEEARRDLTSAGGRPGRTVAATPGGLTASELRVARLAARGLTNREIAAELVVTPHTVRFHLAGAYRKLGVTSRADLAAAVAALP